MSFFNSMLAVRGWEATTQNSVKETCTVLWDTWGPKYIRLYISEQSHSVSQRPNEREQLVGRHECRIFWIKWVFVLQLQTLLFKYLGGIVGLQYYAYGGDARSRNLNRTVLGTNLSNGWLNATVCDFASWSIWFEEVSAQTIPLINFWIKLEEFSVTH